jgi:GT2 family glycosyltransferase
LKNQTLKKGNYVLIINDDTEFDNYFLETAVSMLKNTTRTLLLSQCYSSQTHNLIDAGVHVDWRYLKFNQTSISEEINCLSTRGLFLRIEDLFEIGGFHPKILPHYLSDYEFTIRAYRKGMKLLTLPELRLYLDESTTGYHSIKADSLLKYLKKYFSKKSASNPLYWTGFIALACPFRWKLLNWIRVWKGAFNQIGYYLRNRGEC